MTTPEKIESNICCCRPLACKHLQGAPRLHGMGYAVQAHSATSQPPDVLMALLCFRHWPPSSHRRLCLCRCRAPLSNHVWLIAGSQIPKCPMLHSPGTWEGRASRTITDRAELRGRKPMRASPCLTLSLWTDPMSSREGCRS